MRMKGVVALTAAALMAVVTALAHMSCIFLGASCYKAQLAPPLIVRSAVEGTLVAPIGTILVSSLFLACALFAISGAGMIRRLPLTRIALMTISIVCLVRGLATIPLFLYAPALTSTFDIVAGGIWFVVGCLYLYGFYCDRKRTLREPIMNL